MRAVLCDRWGGPDVLRIGEAPEPAPGPDDVLIAPVAWGVNFADLVLMGGTYHLKPPLPFIPGMEIAGEILTVGHSVTRFQPGDRVAAYVESKGFADRVVASSSATMPLPPTMKFVEAAGFAVTYGTAYIALVHRAQLQPGETLLVLGAAGGVGLAAVEIGRHLGATVIAAASTDDKLIVCQQHGAHHLINYQDEDLVARVRSVTPQRGVDVVFDPVGGDAFDSALRCVAFEGRMIVIGFASGRIPNPSAGRILIKNCSVLGSSWTFTLAHRPDVIRKAFDELSNWYDKGVLQPHISHLFKFERVSEALHLIADRKVTGKVILTDANDD